MSEHDQLTNEGSEVEAYEPPAVEDLETGDGDAVVTAAGFTIG